jgi:hypothetical protein
MYMLVTNFIHAKVGDAEAGRIILPAVVTFSGEEALSDRNYKLHSALGEQSSFVGIMKTVCRISLERALDLKTIVHLDSSCRQYRRSKAPSKRCRCGSWRLSGVSNNKSGQRLDGALVGAYVIITVDHMASGLFVSESAGQAH